MKKNIYLLVILFFLVNNYAFSNPKTQNPNDLIIELANEIQKLNEKFSHVLEIKETHMLSINKSLLVAISLEQKIDLLLQKDILKDEIKALKIDNNSEIAKIRYLKGLQIIKILYEKVLSLDHHFASITTLNEINKISNPNQYPEYEKLKEVVSAKKDKKLGFDLTSILGANPLVSVVQTFTNLIGSSLTKEEKEKEIGTVDCILDFTLRMQNDLNTIYFETAYLQTSNDKIKDDIQVLFKDYTKPIGYESSIDICRTNDDWETITQKTNDYLAKTKIATGNKQYKMQVNIEFPIDRLLQFITQYNSFIDQGGKFYEKFKIILNSYENEKQCETKLPNAYKKLKADIDVAIEKFNIAYKPVEVNGTKMKEILYGLNEFD